MKSILTPSLRVLAWLALPVACPAQTLLGSGHADIGIGYEDGAFDLHDHQEIPEPGAEYEPGEAILQVGPRGFLPGGTPNTPAAVAFFGPPGSLLWVLPKTEDPELLFLGFGTEELDPSEWTSNIALSLAGVEGPGDVFVWDTGPFGELLPRMSSRDGIQPGDRLELLPGSHSHFFVGFSAPGDYRVLFNASGTHATDGAVTSETAAYQFQVIPEPSPVALLGVGALAFAVLRRRQRATS